MSYPPLFAVSLYPTFSSSDETNAQISKHVNNKFSLHNSAKRNEKHQTDFKLENSLTWPDTKFQKRKWKLWTYNYANKTKVQIDYILMNKKWINSTLNCEAYSSFEGVSSDHWIVPAKIHLSLRRNALEKNKTPYYDSSMLINRDITDKYTIILRNKFYVLKEILERLTPNDEYENFITAHMEAAVEFIPNKLRTKHRVSLKTLAVKKNVTT